MAKGRGKYDPECMEVLQKTGAHTVVLIVTGGDRGEGFSVVSTDPAFVQALPDMLEMMAAQIRKDMAPTEQVRPN